MSYRRKTFADLIPSSFKQEPPWQTILRSSPCFFVFAKVRPVMTSCSPVHLACDHPSLVTSSLLVDKDAMNDKVTEPKPDEPDQADELADLLGGLRMAAGKNCEVCFIK